MSQSATYDNPENGAADSPLSSFAAWNQLIPDNCSRRSNTLPEYDHSASYKHQLTPAEQSRNTSPRHSYAFSRNHSPSSSLGKDCIIKLTLLGDSAVGKSCILQRFITDKYDDSPFSPTLGVDYMMKPIDILGQQVKLQIWDTAGQERFRSVTRAYFRDSDAILLVYDICRRESLNNIPSWLQIIREACINRHRIIAIAGNKVDCLSRAVSYSEAEELATKCSCKYFEVSAKTGEGIDAVFLYLATKAHSEHRASICSRSRFAYVEGLPPGTVTESRPSRTGTVVINSPTYEGGHRYGTTKRNRRRSRQTRGTNDGQGYDYYVVEDDCC